MLALYYLFMGNTVFKYLEKEKVEMILFYFLSRTSKMISFNGSFITQD